MIRVANWSGLTPGKEILHLTCGVPATMSLVSSLLQGIVGHSEEYAHIQSLNNLLKRKVAISSNEEANQPYRMPVQQKAVNQSPGNLL